MTTATIAVVVVVLLGLAFDLSNGFHDSSNAIAAPVATGAMRPLQAVTVSAVFNLLGPIVVGTAVADTVGGILAVDTDQMLGVLTCALLAALAWNLLTWWKGLPSSSSHALVGAMVVAGLVTAGMSAVVWGGMDGLRPYGVLGVLVALAISPLLGAGAGWLGERLARRALRRARRGVEPGILRGEWVTSAALAFSHGANDAQKTMGIITAALLAGVHQPLITDPLMAGILSLPLASISS